MSKIEQNPNIARRECKAELMRSLKMCFLYVFNVIISNGLTGHWHSLCKKKTNVLLFEDRYNQTVVGAYNNTVVEKMNVYNVKGCGVVVMAFSSILGVS